MTSSTATLTIALAGNPFSAAQSGQFQLRIDPVAGEYVGENVSLELNSNSFILGYNTYTWNLSTFSYTTSFQVGDQSGTIGSGPTIGNLSQKSIEAAIGDVLQINMSMTAAGTAADDPNWNVPYVQSWFQALIGPAVAPALNALTLNWNKQAGGVDFTYAVTESPLPAATPVALYWATGPTWADRIGEPIYSTMAQNIGSYAIHAPASLFASPPSGAADVLLVVDPDNTLPQSDEYYKLLAIPLSPVNVALKSLTWPPSRDGVQFDYVVSGTLPTPTTAVIGLYWWDGVQADALKFPIFSTPILPVHNAPVVVPFSRIPGFPRGTTQILAVVDPTGSLNETPTANQRLALRLPVITFETNDPDAPSNVVSRYTLRVLTEILVKANERSAEITSTMRTPQRQAEIMYDSLQDNNISHYGWAGQQVIAKYRSDERKHKTRDQIIADMVHVIYQVGPSNVSKHCVDPGAYALKNVIDIAPSSLLNGRRFGLVAQSFYPRVSKVLDPDYPQSNQKYDPAYHLEIPQPSGTGEWF